MPRWSPGGLHLSLPDWCFNLGVSQGLSSSHLRESYWKLLFWVKGKNIFRTFFLKHSKTISSVSKPTSPANRSQQPDSKHDLSNPFLSLAIHMYPCFCWIHQSCLSSKTHPRYIFKCTQSLEGYEINTTYVTCTICLWLIIYMHYPERDQCQPELLLRCGDFYAI